MKTLLKKPLQVLTHLTTGHRLWKANSIMDFSMMSHHTCPCCSYTLLRHIRLGGLYWRCSHCYQEMPAWRRDRVRQPTPLASLKSDRFWGENLPQLADCC